MASIFFPNLRSGDTGDKVLMGKTKRCDKKSASSWTELDLKKTL